MVEWKKGIKIITMDYLEKQITYLQELENIGNLSPNSQEELTELKKIKKKLDSSIFIEQRELLVKAFDLINVHDGDKSKITKLANLVIETINSDKA